MGRKEYNRYRERELRKDSEYRDLVKEYKKTTIVNKILEHVRKSKDDEDSLFYDKKFIEDLTGINFHSLKKR